MKKVLHLGFLLLVLAGGWRYAKVYAKDIKPDIQTNTLKRQTEFPHTVGRYSNPVSDRIFPDPAVLRAPDGNFYAYGTNTKSDVGGQGFLGAACHL